MIRGGQPRFEAISLPSLPMKPHRIRPLAHSILTSSLFICGSVHAAVDTWVGNTSVNWADSNWTGNTPNHRRQPGLWRGRNGGSALVNNLTPLINSPGGSFGN
jgi:hypothetical protein